MTLKGCRWKQFHVLLWQLPNSGLWKPQNSTARTVSFSTEIWTWYPCNTSQKHYHLSQFTWQKLLNMYGINCKRWQRYEIGRWLRQGWPSTSFWQKYENAVNYNRWLAYSSDQLHKFLRNISWTLSEEFSITETKYLDMLNSVTNRLNSYYSSSHL